MRRVADIENVAYLMVIKYVRSFSDALRFLSLMEHVDDNLCIMCSFQHRSIYEVCMCSTQKFY
jgi:hypothetical protein